MIHVLGSLPSHKQSGYRQLADKQLVDKQL